MTEYMSATVGRQSVSTITKTVGITTSSGVYYGILWQLDGITSGESVGSTSCGLNSTFNHSANSAIIIIVYSSMHLPSSVQYTPEMTLNLVASYNAVGSSRPANQPSVALYAGTAKAANSAGNFNASFGSAQGTCLIIAMSWLFPGHGNFTFNNYAVAGPWVGAAGYQQTMGADTNPNRLCLFFASIYGTGGQVFASNGSGLIVLQTIGNYEASPNNSISAQIGYVVSTNQLTETMTGNTLTANGILYPFIGIDPA
jgi:hypothetical protein